MYNLLAKKTLSINNEDKMEKDMPLTISDEELLSMDPELLVGLQKYLKTFRDSNKSSLEVDIDNDEKPVTSNSFNDSLIVIKSWYLEISEAQFDEVETNEGRFLGTRISQDNKTYIARNWKMTEEVKTIITKASKNGFSKLWRQNHPQDRYMIDGPDYLRGSHHIGLSKSHFDPWLFVLGAESLSRRGGVQSIKEITFNKYFGEIIENNSNLINQKDTKFSESLLESNHYRVQNGSGYNYTTHPNDFDQLINIIN